MSSQGEDSEKGGEVVADKTAKLKEILQDYQKLKRKAFLLKQSVQVEQEKCHKLETKLRETDTKYREQSEKYEKLQVTYRALLKKCQVLQKDLDKSRDAIASGGKGWGSFLGGGSAPMASQAMEHLQSARQELSLKIEENEMLHMKLHDLKKEHQQTTDMLESKLSTLKKSEKQKEDNSAQRLCDLEKQVVELETLKGELEDRLQHTTHQLKSLKDSAKEQAATVEEQKQKALQTVTNLQKEMQLRMPFVDNKDSILHAFNLPLFDSSGKSPLHTEAVHNGVLSLSLAFRSFGEYLEAFKNKVQEDLKNPTVPASGNLESLRAKLLQVLSAHSSLVHNLRKILSKIADDIRAGESVIESAKELYSRLEPFRDSNKVLVNLMVVCLREESVVRSPEIQEKNQQIAAAYLQTHKSISAIVAAAEALKNPPSPSSSSSSSSPSSSPSLSPSLSSISENKQDKETDKEKEKETKGEVYLLWAMDHTLDSLQNLHRKMLFRREAEERERGGREGRERREGERERERGGVSEEIVSSLGSLVSFFTRAVSFLNVYVESQKETDQGKVVLGAIQVPSPQFWSVESKNSKGTSEEIVPLRQRNQSYLEKIHSNSQNEKENLTYEDVLHQRNRLEECEVEVNDLSEKLQKKTEQAIAARNEKEVEHARVCELLDQLSQKQVIIDKLRQQLATSAPSPAAGLNSDVNVGEEIPSAEHTVAEWIRTSSKPEPGTKYKMQVVDSDGTVASSLAFKPEDEEREKELLEYHSKQISQLRKGYEEAHNKIGLKSQQLEKSMSSSRTMKGTIENLNEDIKAKETKSQILKEELDLTRNNYEEQIKMMTEHIVSLGDEIAGLKKRLNADVYCSKCRTFVRREET